MYKWSARGSGQYTTRGRGQFTTRGRGQYTTTSTGFVIRGSAVTDVLKYILNTYINKKKKTTNIYSENSVSYSLVKFLLDKIRMNYPESKEPDLQQWALYIDRMG